MLVIVRLIRAHRVYETGCRISHGTGHRQPRRVYMIMVLRLWLRWLNVAMVRNSIRP